MSDPMLVFDRRAVRTHRDRAARLLPGADFLLREATERLCERLDDVRRPFRRILDLGCHGGLIAERLAGRDVELLVQADLSPAMLGRAAGLRVAADEERLPFAPASFDLVLSALSLHWVNDLPGALLQINRCLRPDGLLLASLLGGETLTELRQALVRADAEIEGGASPRISPFADIRDAGGLLQRAGFALPVVDSERITVTYPDALALMRDLRAMGEANAVRERRRQFSRRTTLARAAACYEELFATADGRLPATFQILTLTGWCPHESQPRPLRRGSAGTRLAAALGVEEHSLPDKTRPS